jgi:hypothetical protein
MRFVAIAIVLLIASEANAAELLDPAGRDYVIERPSRASRVVVRHRRIYVWKQIGMPCLLTPDEIVRRNWNGPQCRWADNM